MKTIILIILSLVVCCKLCVAQVVNGAFTTGDLTGWSQAAFRDTLPSLFISNLQYGATPNFARFQSSQNIGLGVSTSNNGVVTQQADNFDGNGPFLTSTPVAAPSGTPIAFITNHNADAATNGNTLVGSSILQTFFVPNDATQLTLLARQLSNEGLNTATSPSGQAVGADFGGIALHSGSTIFGQYLFDEQSNSAANFHVANFSPDGSTGFGGFVSGTGWQTLTFNLTGVRGQNVTLTAFETNTGDVNFESRLLIANVIMNRSVAAAPEAGAGSLLAMAFLPLGLAVTKLGNQRRTLRTM